MMTLDEAIKHAEEKAKEQREKAKLFSNNPFYSASAKGCEKCAEEHEQLAEWLKQLKELKEAYESDYQVDDLIQVCVRLWG